MRNDSVRVETKMADNENPARRGWVLVFPRLGFGTGRCSFVAASRLNQRASGRVLASPNGLVG